MGDQPEEEKPKDEVTKEEEQDKTEPLPQEEAKEEAPKEEAPKDEEAPKEEAPKEEAPKEEVPKEEAAKEEPPTEEAPKEEAAPVEEAEEVKPTEEEQPKDVEEAKPDEASPAEVKPEEEESPTETKTVVESHTEREHYVMETKTSQEIVIEQYTATYTVNEMDPKNKEKKSLVDMTYEAKSRLSGIQKGISSKAKAIVGSTLSFKKYGLMEGQEKGKSRYMNTYKLNSEKPFNPEKVQKILEDVMVEALEELVYDADKCPKQAKWAAQTIKNRVKEMEFDRYKLICIVTIGEKNSQDVLVTSRFLWDPERDRHATYVHENTQVFGIAQCFGLYYE